LAAREHFVDVKCYSIFVNIRNSATSDLSQAMKHTAGLNSAQSSEYCRKFCFYLFLFVFF